MSELKCCPFCGGEAEMLNYSPTEWLVHCIECDGMVENWRKTEQEAIEQWNRRIYMANIVDKLEEEKQRLKGLKNDCIALSDSEVIAIEEKAYNFAINIVKQEINNGLE